MEDYLKEPSTKDVDLANEKNKAQEEDSMIEDSHESREYFKMFENKKRKRNVVRSRFFRPRSCKKKEVFPFTTKEVLKLVRLEYDELKLESVPQRLQIELKHLAWSFLFYFVKISCF